MSTNILEKIRAEETRARISLIRAHTAGVLTCVELVCTLALSVAWYKNDATGVMAAGFILLGSFLGMVRISIENVAQSISERS